MAKTAAVPISSQNNITKTHWTVRAYVDKDEVSKAKVKSHKLSIEDMQIVAALEDAANDMAFIHSCFDHITEELLIDCLIYELKAVSLRHKYFLELCKERGIVSGSPKK
ncbi:MAG: YaaL family protein [Defluviitaleaceae bacterium]|nr:YaaL family protein [Defluviitaleaceae bacterium]